METFRQVFKLISGKRSDITICHLRKDHNRRITQKMNETTKFFPVCRTLTSRNLLSFLGLADLWLSWGFSRVINQPSPRSLYPKQERIWPWEKKQKKLRLNSKVYSSSQDSLVVNHIIIPRSKNKHNPPAEDAWCNSGRICPIIQARRWNNRVCNSVIKSNMCAICTTCTMCRQCAPDGGPHAGTQSAICDRLVCAQSQVSNHDRAINGNRFRKTVKRGPCGQNRFFTVDGFGPGFIDANYNCPAPTCLLII